MGLLRKAMHQDWGAGTPESQRMSWPRQLWSWRCELRPAVDRVSAIPKRICNGGDAVGAMTKVKSGLVYIGSEDKVIPAKSMIKLVNAIPALTLVVRIGEPHDMLNMNQNGERASTRAVEFMLTFAADKLKEMKE